MNSDLKEEYRNVRFRYSDQDIPAEFFVITAHNPDGQTVDEQTNSEANRKLSRAISDLGFPLVPVTGGSPDFSHVEPGFAVSCSREQALELARRFRQDAVFEIMNGRVHLVSALPNPGPDEDIGAWSELGEVVS